MKRREPIFVIERGIWYYFTADLAVDGFFSFRFVRFIGVDGNRTAALVRFTEQEYLGKSQLLLLPYKNTEDAFQANAGEIVAVTAFDGSNIENESTLKLASDWPHNIFDKASITPSIDTAKRLAPQDQWR